MRPISPRGVTRIHHSRSNRFVRIWTAIVSLLLVGSGCTSAKYKVAKTDTPPAVLYNLPSTQPPAEVLLHTVIIFRGPGSWKRNAYWDEYVVTIANRGNAPLEVYGASLTSTDHARTTPPFSDPWKLESESRHLLESGFGAAQHMVVQLGGGALAVGSGAAILSISSGGAVLAAASGAMMALPAFIGGSVYTNLSNRKAIMREFQNHRLALPVALVPGELVQGSLFFPVFPAPATLTLKCRYQDELKDITIDLSPISGLHLKPEPTSVGIQSGRE